MLKQTITISAITALLTLGGAFIFQWAGYHPCDLCLKGRYIWWGILIISPILFLSPPPVQKSLLRIVMLGLSANTVLSVYHAGGEWQWWSLQNFCAATQDISLDELFARPVPCDEAAFRFLGISLAGYNAVISLVLACFISYNIKHAK